MNQHSLLKSFPSAIRARIAFGTCPVPTCISPLQEAFEPFVQGNLRLSEVHGGMGPGIHGFT